MVVLNTYCCPWPAILVLNTLWPTTAYPGLSAGGSFGQGLNDNFPGPAATGWYKATYDFQKGLFTVASFPNAQSTDLWITGDATASSWTNSPPAAQKFTRLNNCEYEITIAFVPGKVYKFLSVSGQWQPQFGGTSATGGDLGATMAVVATPMPSPLRRLQAITKSM